MRLSPSLPDPQRLQKVRGGSHLVLQRLGTRFFLSLVGLFWLASCNAPAVATLTPTPLVSTIEATPSPQPTSTETPIPTGTASPTVVPSPSATLPPSTTPQPLAQFTSRLLRPNILPQAYLPDSCEYLRLRWSPQNSVPGSVVVPVMFHSIQPGNEEPRDDTSINQTQFEDFTAYAHRLGFETITAQQLIDFLYHNAPIPPRSMILIVDDRRPGVVRNYMLPAAEKYNWTVTLGWIIGDTGPSLWAEMEELNQSGRLDVQSHGYLHQYIVENTPEEKIRQELFDPQPLIEEHFGKRPVAFVWPGGNFTSLSTQIAHEAGYQIAFTAYSRGPLMFNWIPQGEEERAVGDPLMTLPRFWSPALTVNLEVGKTIGDAAQAEALQNYPREAEYYHTYCGGELPPPPTLTPTPTPTVTLTPKPTRTP